ncbi:hypothetical protein [Streptomyces chryseus]|uniref:hypothetical protein n=1 Tax=Streptomyces chryseus TaxID=68186 RepID=UPI00110FE5E0|nr:hypothetical protein [Streptomyces chryseus]GGX02032.1 hypothetical protein GCM10010353_17090 [Streptomyces chryseus]
MTSPGLTLTGLAISLAVLYANLRPWWKGGHEAKKLIPFGSAFVLGAASTVCAGGILGWLAGCTVSAANRGGSTGTGVVTGTASEAPLSRGSMGQLTPEGALVVFLLTIGVVLAWKAAAKAEQKRMAGGAFCGSTLCVTAGFASLLDWLPGLFNEGGAQLRAIVENSGGVL